MNVKLEDIYSQIPRATCVDGCGKCCGPVFPSSAEVRNIKEWCLRRHMGYRDFLEITEGGHCPYLTTDMRCSIYPVRPFLCRMLGASSDTPCPVGGCSCRKVLNHPQSDALYGAVYLRGKEKRRTEKHRELVRQCLEVVAPQLLKDRERC